MAGHPLEAATAAAVADYNSMKSKLATLDIELREAAEREAILKGHVQSCTLRLDEAKADAAHYLRWNCELSKQMHNIGMFVQDALMIARAEIAKGNGRDQQQALEAVERAITEVKDQ